MQIQNMKLKVKYFLISLIGCLGLLSACNDLDNYSTNSSHTLEFSYDTLHLDTILTGVGTSTHILKVYNRHKEPLLISSIQLADAANSGFRINVDGIKGTSFTDVEIRQKDSLFVFIEATLFPQDSDEPIFKRDSIVFITNGVRQDVKLQAYGQDFVAFRGKQITEDTLINSRRPIVIYDSLVIKENAKLTLTEGVRLYFHGKSGIQVYGQMVAQGSLANPIVFRGDRTDNMFAHLPYDKLPGQWDGIRIHSGSFDNEFDQVDIHGGIFGIRCDSAGIERQKLTFTNSIIHQVSGDALNMTDCKATIGNSQISNAGGYCVNLTGGEYEFVHCTIANYYSWDIKRGVALRFVNERNDIPYPLSLASFRNCLIAGSSNDEIIGASSADESIPFNYYFSNCLVNSTELENDQIVNVTWKKDDRFITLDSREQNYDFRIDSLSAAINIAALEDAQLYPYDLMGNTRLADEAPDAGCFEWIPNAK